MLSLKQSITTSDTVCKEDVEEQEGGGDDVQRITTLLDKAATTGLMKEELDFLLRYII